MRAPITYFKYLYYLTCCFGYKKAYNYILNTIEKKQKKVYLKSLPVNVTIEPCNVCNLNCPECATGIRHPEAIEPSMLSLEQFKYINILT